MSRSNKAIVSGSGTNSISFQPGSNLDYELIYMHVLYTSSSSPGNRELELALLDSGSNVVGDWHCGAYITASKTDQHVEWQGGIYRETSFVNGKIQVPFPLGLTVPAGYTLKIYDSAGIDSSGDSISTYIQVRKLPA